MNIAGGKVSKVEFHDCVECVVEAIFLQGWKKSYLKLKYFFTIPCLMYVKYLIFIQKIYRYLISHISGVSRFCECWLRSKFDPYQKFLPFLDNKLYSVALVVIRLQFWGANFILFLFVLYYITFLPFFILAFPLKFFILGFNFSSFSIVEKVFISFYVCFFPQIKTFIYDDQALEHITNSFEIKPIKIMSAVPFLVLNRTMSWGDYFFWLFMVMLNLVLISLCVD